jgi:hypothetical protein
MFWLVRLEGKDDEGNWIFSEAMSPLKALRYDRDTFQLVHDLSAKLLADEKQIEAGQRGLWDPIDSLEQKEDDQPKDDDRVYYKILQTIGKESSGDPMTPFEAQQHNNPAFLRLLWCVTALYEMEQQQAAGQLDLFSDRPVDADVLPGPTNADREAARQVARAWLESDGE